MKILVLMAGDSKAFASDIYKFPKFLLEVNGKPLIQHLVNSFSSLKESDFIFIVKNFFNCRVSAKIFWNCYKFLANFFYFLN